MARPLKKGVDYFPFDVNLDSKWELIEAEFGLVGFALLVKIYQNIYKNSYYWNITEDELLLTSKRVNVDVNLINDVINRVIERNLFDNGIYKKYSILTSKGVQERYFEIIKRRDVAECYEELMLTETPINVTLTPINVYTGTQSKVKESKGEKTKPKKTKEVAPKVALDLEDSETTISTSEKSEKDLFLLSLKSYFDEYPQFEKDISDFYNSWTAKADNGKMLFQNNPKWDIKTKIEKSIAIWKERPSRKKKTKLEDLNKENSYQSLKKYNNNGITRGLNE